MGTRGITCSVIDGGVRIAQYGQWDHYLEGQGQNIVDFLHTADLEKLKSQIRQYARFATDEERVVLEKEYDSNEGTDEEFFKKYPSLSRGIGSDILKIVYEATDVVILFNDIKFASNSLLCEYGYVVELDNDVLEIYRGFNTEPVPEGERFSDFPLREYTSMEQYYPISLFKTFPIDKNLRTNYQKWIEQLNKEEEEINAELIR